MTYDPNKGPNQQVTHELPQAVHRLQVVDGAVSRIDAVPAGETEPPQEDIDYAYPEAA